jgi:acetyl-CoA carboxylase carboxyl transferase subunit beta
MRWFKRNSKGITTETSEKKDIKSGLWFKCPECGAILPIDKHAENLNVCSECGYHDGITARRYFEILFDSNKYEIIADELRTADPLNFVDTKPYAERIEKMVEKTGETEAITVAVGKMKKQPVVIAAMNFNFIGGSMGSVVGERIARAIDHCIENRLPLIIISRSGGARMMESALSLMQMAKTSAKLTQLADAKLPYISLMTNPTTGGVSASFAMLGDLNIAEPKALIAFAGPRVIKETIKRDLPEGFQRSEFLLEKGFLDYIVERKNLKDTLAKQLKLFAN